MKYSPLIGAIGLGAAVVVTGLAVSCKSQAPAVEPTPATAPAAAFWPGKYDAVAHLYDALTLSPALTDPEWFNSADRDALNWLPRPERPVRFRVVERDTGRPIANQPVELTRIETQEISLPSVERWMFKTTPGDEEPSGDFRGIPLYRPGPTLVWPAGPPGREAVWLLPAPGADYAPFELIPLYGTKWSSQTTITLPSESPLDFTATWHNTDADGYVEAQLAPGEYSVLTPFGRGRLLVPTVGGVDALQVEISGAPR